MQYPFVTGINRRPHDLLVESHTKWTQHLGVALRDDDVMEIRSVQRGTKNSGNAGFVLDDCCS
jgi:hypothetical protein